ncbi:uncharacterized protein [Ptychodera flava]|uniref:uncharacterized protein n=1 Tax=Ptychodera flava TaxID=63121 RepID=UPI00396A5032
MGHAAKIQDGGDFKAIAGNSWKNPLKIYMFKSIIFHIYFCTPHRVRWNLPECSKDTNSIEFDGVPFIVVGKLVLECHQGKEKTRKAKQAQQLNDDHGSYKKKRFLVQPSKKIGCPAQVIMREVIRFDQFKVKNLFECHTLCTLIQ